MKSAWISAAFLAFACFFQNGDAAITAWTTPTITSAADGTGTLSIAEDQATATTIETYVATTGATSVTYSLATAVSPFSVDSAGALTITDALDFETTTSYTLLIKAVDDVAGSGTATITVTVTNVNEAPAFAASYNPCIADGSLADTTLVTVSATDPDSGDSVTYGISGTDFKIDSTSGLIQVNTGVTLVKATTSSYALVVTATDNTLTTTSTVSVTVANSCSSAVGVAVSLMVLLAALLVNIF
ncbi:protocadherin gamma-A5-like [Mercenaria mercenaria]|uniref:protocadherin gamma-A5-like n=1 Tax=Mercenaria mercenaria TaxID=6596 RepID=UPI00234F5035|nr:protocadherin gamma-A5-like [Mercenaria mercenaria]